MDTKWKSAGFDLEFTDDGSPTLRQNDFKTESMHHSGGAYAETEYIYTPAICKTLSLAPHPHFFILGLGLGYIEMIIARESLKKGLCSKDIRISSYESNEKLRSFFWSWLCGEQNEVYDQILGYIEPDKKHQTEIKSFLVQSFKDQNGIQGAFSESEFQKLNSINCYLYDAFSSKTSSELWTEEFLSLFLEKTKADQCEFATYACTGNLKRALKRSGFSLSIQRGFNSKRDYTRATFKLNPELVDEV